jgi:hypothetical protein
MCDLLQNPENFSPANDLFQGSFRLLQGDLSTLNCLWPILEGNEFKILSGKMELFRDRNELHLAKPFRPSSGNISLGNSPMFFA